MKLERELVPLDQFRLLLGPELVVLLEGGMPWLEVPLLQLFWGKGASPGLEGGVGALHDLFLNGLVESCGEHLLLNKGSNILARYVIRVLVVGIGCCSLGHVIQFAGKEAFESFYVLG